MCQCQGKLRAIICQFYATHQSFKHAVLHVQQLKSACRTSHTPQHIKARLDLADLIIIRIRPGDLLCLGLPAIICSQVFWTIVHQARQMGASCVCSRLCMSHYACCAM